MAQLRDQLLAGKIVHIWMVYCITPDCRHAMRLIANWQTNDPSVIEVQWLAQGTMGWTKAGDGCWWCPECSRTY